MDLKKYRNKAEMKTCKNTTLLQKNSGKERQDNYTTSAVCFFFPIFDVEDQTALPHTRCSQCLNFKVDLTVQSV